MAEIGPAAVAHLTAALLHGLICGYAFGERRRSLALAVFWWLNLGSCSIHAAEAVRTLSSQLGQRVGPEGLEAIAGHVTLTILPFVCVMAVPVFWGELRRMPVRANALALLLRPLALRARAVYVVGLGVAAVLGSAPWVGGLPGFGPIDGRMSLGLAVVIGAVWVLMLASGLRPEDRDATLAQPGVLVAYGGTLALVAAECFLSQRFAAEVRIDRPWPEAKQFLLLDGEPRLEVRMGYIRGRYPWFSRSLGLLRMAGALVQAHLLLLDEMEARQAGERKTRELAILLARAEAAALRAQIRPHFLFNTLNTIHSLVREDPAAAEETIERFSDLLRGVIQGIDRDCWCLGRELDLAEAYLAIERMRHGDRLRCTVVVDEEARRCDVPVFSLQPLVENAVQHAVEESPEPTTIRIEAEVAGGRLEIRVTDDGPGLLEPGPGLLEPGPGLSEPEPGDRRHAGFGLAIDNIRERLRRLYGAEAGLELSSPGRGVCATLTMPRALTAERQGSST